MAFLVKKKGGSIPAELGNPVVFTKDYVKYRPLSQTTYEQGTSGLVTKVYEGSLWNHTRGRPLTGWCVST
jgi:hypothetical protein